MDVSTPLKIIREPKSLPQLRIRLPAQLEDRFQLHGITHDHRSTCPIQEWDHGRDITLAGLINDQQIEAASRKRQT